MRSLRLALVFVVLGLSRGAPALPSTCPSPLWSIVPAATRPGGGSGVAVLSPSNVWGVGGDGSGQPAVEHWDGSTWSMVPTPVLGNGLFHKIAAIAPDDIWAVGFANTQAQALAEHWDGTAWTVVPTQNPGTVGNELFDVAGSGPNDVWAVGVDTSIVGGFFTSSGLIEHWDGTAWSPPTAPTMPNTNLFAVYALSSTSAWAVGSSGAGGVLLHWDGTQWSNVSVPAGAYDFHDVRAFSDTDIWVVGSGPNDGLPATPAPPLALHFDGTSWAFHPGAVPPGNGGLFLQVFGGATDDLWAAGNQGSPMGAGVTALIDHWDGTSWTVVPSPAAATELDDIDGTPDGSDLWAAGFDASHLLVEHGLCGAGPTTTTSTSTTTTTLEDTGFLPRDRNTARCQCAIGKGVAKLAARIMKCHQSRAEGKKITDELGEENCERAAKTKFSSRATTIAANCPCTNPAATADQIELLVDSNNSKIYCSAGAAWGLDDTGNVPSSSTAASCENGLAKGIAKLIGRLMKCHCLRASGKLADEASEDQCESAAKVRFTTIAGSGCDPCEGTMSGLADFFESQVDGVNGLIYCASPGGAFLEPLPARYGMNQGAMKVRR